MQTMCENPEILFVDFVQRKNKEWQKNNLLFFSDSIHIWKEVLCSNYAHVISEGIGSGGRLTICKDEHLDKDNPILTIHYYTNGKVLIQSSEAHLNSFEEGFPLLKAEVHSKKISVLSGEEVKVLFENPNTLSICAPPTPTNSATQLKHSIALLELDFAEFREQIQTRLSDRTDNTSLQQLSEELQQLRTENQSLASELRGNLEEIRQENIALRTQMVKVKEDAVKRERSLTRQVQHLTEKLSCTPKMSSTETQTLPASIPKYGHVSVPSSQLETQPSSTPAPTMTPVPVSNSQLCTSKPPQTQPVEKAPQAVLLADSNGRYLDTRKLFPGMKVLYKVCSNTDHGMKLLRKETLGSPQYLVIHTGTNDLRRLRDGTAEAVVKMAEQASKEFPHSHIVVSTLLPRTDIPPHIIHGTNMHIDRRCSRLPNVHLAHHPTIGTWDLHDGLHLHRDKVRIFAKTLKTALRNGLISTRAPKDLLRPPPPQDHPRTTPPTVRRHSSSDWNWTTVHRQRNRPPSTTQHFPQHQPQISAGPPVQCPSQPQQRPTRPPTTGSPPHTQHQRYATPPPPCPPAPLQQRNYGAPPGPCPSLPLHQRNYWAPQAPCPPPQQQQSGYAAVVSTGHQARSPQQNCAAAAQPQCSTAKVAQPSTTDPAISELGDIRQMLQTICQRLLVR